jgi:hypothetical protein
MQGGLNARHSNISISRGTRVSGVLGMGKPGQQLASLLWRWVHCKGRKPLLLCCCCKSAHMIDTRCTIYGERPFDSICNCSCSLGRGQELGRCIVVSQVGDPWLMCSCCRHGLKFKALTASSRLLFCSVRSSAIPPSSRLQINAQITEAATQGLASAPD